MLHAEARSSHGSESSKTLSLYRTAVRLATAPPSPASSARLSYPWPGDSRSQLPGQTVRPSLQKQQELSARACSCFPVVYWSLLNLPFPKSFKHQHVGTQKVTAKLTGSGAKCLSFPCYSVSHCLISPKASYSNENSSFPQRMIEID